MIGRNQLSQMRITLILIALLFGLGSCSVQKQIAKSAKAAVLDNKALQAAHVGISIYDPTSKQYLYNYQGREEGEGRDEHDHADQQDDAPCVWIPPEPGELTVTARITYDVVFTVSGFADVLAPYVWSSSPLTVRVDELSVVNTRTGN